MNYTRGIIIKYVPRKRFGFISTKGSPDIFFHINQFSKHFSPEIGTHVRFNIEKQSDGRLRAKDITPTEAYSLDSQPKPEPTENIHPLVNTNTNTNDIIDSTYNTETHKQDTLKGEIVLLPQGKPYGFIQDENKCERFFNLSDFHPADRLRVGTNVEFEPFVMQTGGQRARKIVAIQNQKSREVFSEMSSWKKEAKSEDVLRYFYQNNHLHKIEDGHYCYVIGRKGSGKTAIGEFILKTKRYDRFSTRLSFKNVPFNRLYRQEDKDFTFPNQYQTMWKYVIYNHASKLALTNEAIPKFKRDELEKALLKFDNSYKPGSTKQKVDHSFNLKIFGLGYGFNKSSEHTSEYLFSEAVECLEDLLMETLDQSQYFLLFDELDEDYKNTLNQTEHHKYAALLTSLFKAVLDVKSKFKHSQLMPVVLLRDDIFQMLEDPDRTKWKDLSVELTWKEHALRDLLAFRITKAATKKSSAYRPQFVFKEIFEKDLSQETGNHYFFKHISQLSLMRPRDIVEYMRACGVLCIERCSDLITPDILKDAEESYSRYFQSELVDETHVKIPDIRKIFDILSLIGRKTFKYKQFASYYRDFFPNCATSKLDDDLEKLFDFGVLGIKRMDGTGYIFKHLHPTTTYNARAGFAVHRGLFSALNIIE